MTAKDFFLQVYDAQIEIESTKARLETYRATMYGVAGLSGDATGIKAKGRHSDPVSRAVERMDKLEREMMRSIEHYQEVIEKAELILSRMEPVYRRNRPAIAKYKEILTRRYIQMQDWETIKTEMHYPDENGMFKIHKKALELAEHIMYEDTVVLQSVDVL